MRSVVVGGGPAGLAAAFRLSLAPSHTVEVLEKAPVLGGLAAGFRHGDATLDFGPHRLHLATDPVVLSGLRQLLGDDLARKRRRGRIWLRDRILPYPVGPRTLSGLGLPTLARLGVGFAAKPTSARDSYESAVVSQLGRPLYDLFYGPYAQKVWGQPGLTIAAEQADKRVNQRGFLDLLRLAVGRGAGGAFFYPRHGFGQIPAAYAGALRERVNVRLECGARVERIHWHRNRISRVDDRQADHLVWSAPLPELVRRLDPAPPAEISEAASGLRFRAVVLVYLVLELPRIGEADTYYFPEARFPFNRVIEQKNFSDCIVPPDRTILGLDISCDADDPTWTASDAQLLERVLPALRSVGLVRGRVVEVFSRRFRSAYPIYDLQAAERLATVQAWLARFENVWLIGRQGLYLHNNTHHSLLMGYRAADAIVSNARVTWPWALAEFATFRVAD